MSSSYTIHLLALRNRQFTEGIASAFDYTPVTRSYNVSPTPNAADARAIASDFLVTGNDMRAALAEYERTR